MVTECEIPPAQFLSEKPDKALARPGVYAILCDVSGKYYVGMSKNIARRMPEHEKSLRLGNHINRKLQGSYKKYGASHFLFKAVALVDGGYGDLYSQENEWIQRLDSVRSGMNMMDAEEFRPGSLMTEAGKKFHSERMKKKMESAQVPYDLISPEGIRYSGLGISGFCKSMGLNRQYEGAFSKMMRCQAMSHNGWRPFNPCPKKIRAYSRINVLSPHGDSFLVKNQVNFCSIHNLPIKKFREMCCGYTKECNGWTLSNPSLAKARSYNGNLGTKIKSPSGEIVSIKCMRDFCLENGLSSSAIYLVLKGKRPHHKNWRKI